MLLIFHISRFPSTQISVLACGLLLASAAQAATITVNSSSDALSLSGGCTLRGAIGAINAGVDRNGCTATGSSYGINNKIVFSLPANARIVFGSEIKITENLMIDGTLAGQSAPTAPTVVFDGNRATRLLYASNALTLTNLTIQNGHSAAGGGAVYSAGPLSIDKSHFNGNSSSGSGGAIYADNFLSVTESSFSENRSEAYWTGSGGAIYASDRVMVSKSTFASNKAYSSDGTVGTGGAITADQLSAENSTFVGNAAGGYGGAINSYGAFTGSYLTLVNNIAPKGAAIYIDRSGDLKNSIIAGDPIVTTAQCGGYSNGYSSFKGGTNLEWRQGVGSKENSCQSANPVTVTENARLADIVSSSLGNNGGPTLTLALPTGSPAIDAGDRSVIAASDQRGMARVVGSAPDLGALEYDDSIHIDDKSGASATVTGSLTAQTITGHLIVDDAHRNKAGKVFVLVNLAPFTDPSGFVIMPGYTVWAYDGMNLSLIFPQATLEQICTTLPAYYSGPLRTMEDMPLIPSAFDLTLFAGSEIYIGFGKNNDLMTPGAACMDMATNGTHWHVYTLK